MMPRWGAWGLWEAAGVGNKNKLHLGCYAVCRFSAGGCAEGGEGGGVCPEWGLFRSFVSREEWSLIRGVSGTKLSALSLWCVVKLGQPRGIEPAWAPFPCLKGDKQRT